MSVGPLTEDIGATFVSSSSSSSSSFSSSFTLNGKNLKIGSKRTIA